MNITNKITKLGLTTEGEELRKIILENPDLPIAVLVGENAFAGDFYWNFASKITYSIEEILNADTPFLSDSNRVFNNREDFEIFIGDWLYSQNDNNKLSEKDFDNLLRSEIEKYDPYWVKCICIYADN